MARREDWGPPGDTKVGAPREDRPPGYHRSPGALEHGSGLFTCPLVVYDPRYSP